MSWWLYIAGEEWKCGCYALNWHKRHHFITIVITCIPPVCGRGFGVKMGRGDSGVCDLDTSLMDALRQCAFPL
jgi:hypothetical protein